MNQRQGADADATEVVGAARPAGDGATLAAGVEIGAYRILRLLGEGGMGSVYLAEQQSPVFRQVALKIIRPELSNPMARVWFEVERQALAQMRHPCIAQVFDAGATHDGTLFLAMELVDGVPITQFCRAHRLSRTERLELFRQVCLGVHHAHQKGVIHRDLKPDNVLVSTVDGVPQPKIIDFGIAIGGAGAGAAAHPDRAGTRAYMSPEQASPELRDIDTRSDVYSLGVMLLELLTGADVAGIAGLSFHSGAARADADEGPGPALDKLLKAAAPLAPELRALLRKALATERAERYESAAQLAEDLKRFLEQRPLVAMPATRAYATRKFIQRHRLGLVAAALVIIALVVGLVLALAAERRAQAQAARAAQVSRFIGDILSGADPDEAKGLDTTLLRKLLDRAGERAERELAAQPEARLHVLGTIADSYVAIGEYDAARRYADVVLKDLPAAGLDRADRVRAIAGATRVINLAGDVPRALEIATAAQDLARKLAPDDPRRLQLEEEMAWYEWNLGRLEAALARMERAYALRIEADTPDEAAIDSDMRLIAGVTSDMGDYARAEKANTELLERARARYGDEDSRTLTAANELAIIMLRRKSFAEGERFLREWLPRAQHRLGADHPSTMSMYSNLGGAIRQQGRNEEARPYYEETLAYNLGKYGAKSPPALYSRANLAFLLRDAGELERAEAYARTCVADMDEALGTDNGYRGAFPDLLGTILLRAQRYAEAEQAFTSAWTLFSSASGYGATHPQALEVAQHLVELYTAWGRPDDAKRWQQRAAAKIVRDA